jgi:S1-C subfamily serine protease
VIKSVGGKRITDPTQLSTVVSAKKPGDQTTVIVTRDGSSQTVQVTLGTRPASTSSP